MNIHEYQAKQVLSKCGVRVVKGAVAYTAMEAEAVAKELGGPIWVVKSQIHAGGRGRGKFKEEAAGNEGGVRVVKSVAEAKQAANQMLGATLVTHQTGPEGKEVKRIYIEEASDISKEFYLSCLVDRESSKIAFISSTEGGMDIEAVAEETPHLIFTEEIDPKVGLTGFQCRKVAFNLGLSGTGFKEI